jgi:vancomycin resistance protein YoaR
MAGFTGFLVQYSFVYERYWCVARSEMQLYARKVEKDDEARSAALALLARGMLTPGQAADLAGVSRQLVYYWLKQHGIDWHRAWARRQAGIWRREIASINGKVLQPPTKKELRRRATRAKAEFDAKHVKPS